MRILRAPADWLLRRAPLPFTDASSDGRSFLRTLLLLAATCSAFTITLGAHADPSSKPPELGHNYAEHETPRMTGVGGPNRATSNSISALYSNPANTAAAQVYHVGAMAQIHPESKRQSYGGGVVDSLISSTGLAGGLGAVWTLQDPDGIRREWLDLRFALGISLGDMFLLGLMGKYVTLQQNGVGPLGPSRVSGGLEESNIIQTITFDAGVTFRPVPEFSVSLVGHNLTNPETALLPLMGGLGIGLQTANFTLSGDAVLESRTFSETFLRFSGGGEALLADHVALRGGYRYDAGMETHSLSGGAGYMDRKFSVDASLRRGVAGEIYTAVVFGFTIHIEAMGLGSSDPNY